MLAYDTYCLTLFLGMEHVKLASSQTTLLQRLGNDMGQGLLKKKVVWRDSSNPPLHSGSLSDSVKTGKQKLIWRSRREIFLPAFRSSIVSSFFFSTYIRYLCLLSGFTCCQQHFELGYSNCDLRCLVSTNIFFLKGMPMYKLRLWNILLSQRATSSYSTKHPKGSWI